MYEAIRQIKKTFGNKVLIAVDICLCPYTTSGHCGVFFSNGQEEIDNEKSIGILAEMAGKMAQGENSKVDTLAAKMFGLTGHFTE